MREAIEFELNRKGQIFIVVPFIKHIIEITKQLTDMGFEDKYKIAHGKFTPSELSTIMDDFAQDKIKILLSTSIIESGTNILNANTIIVINSEQFGLSQLYQLRGRVGRGEKTGRALFLHSENITQESLKRLNILKSLSTLSDGFKIASYDMENRGYGNLLSKKQSGHIKEIGISLYNEMLQSALMKVTIHDKPPEIKIGQVAKIAKEYIKDDNIRMHYYKRVCDLYKTEDENTIKQEIEIGMAKYRVKH